MRGEMRQAWCLLVFVPLAIAVPLSSLVAPVVAHDTMEHADFVQFLTHGVVDERTYDREAASILSGADPSMHHFLSMLEESTDETQNLQNLVSVFLELPPSASQLGDFDDGGPESVRISATPADKQPILAKLGRRIPSPPEAAPKDAALTQQALVSEDSVLGGEAGKSSAIPTHFSDNTENLGALTQTVDEMQYQLDQLTRFLKRRLKCRVNPEGCQETTPVRETKPKEECTRRFKYLCRTTYELTPGASSSQTGGIAPELLVQSSATSTGSHAPVTVTLASKGHSQSTIVPSGESDAVLKKLVDKQKHQIEEQAELIKKATTQIKSLLSKDNKAPAQHIHQGTVADTGAHKVTEGKFAATHHAAPETSAPAPEVRSVDTPNESVVAAKEEAVTSEPVPEAAAEEVATPTTPETTTLEVATPDLEATADASAPQPATEEFKVEEPELGSDPAADSLPTATGQTVGAKPEQEQEAAAVADGAPAAKVDEPASAPTLSVPETLEEAQNLQQAQEAYTNHLMGSLGEAEAKARAFEKARKVKAKTNVHAKASQFAKHLLSTKAKGGTGARHMFVPQQYRGVNNLLELDEGSESSTQLPGMPNSEFITQMAAAAYDTLHSGTEPAQFGVEALVEVDEGPEEEEEHSIVHKMAVKAAEVHAESQVSAVTELLLDSARSCTQRATDGMCELFDDQTRCLRTAPGSALCGFAVDGDKRHFGTVPVERLM